MAACREKCQLATSVVQMACTVATTTAAAAAATSAAAAAATARNSSNNDKPYGHTKAFGAQFDVKRVETEGELGYRETQYK